MDYTEATVPITTSKTFTCSHVLHSVQARLIGKQPLIYAYDDRHVIQHGGTALLTLSGA